MKRFSLVSVLSLAFVMPAWAAPSPDLVFGDGWEFNALTDVLSFNPLSINAVYGGTTDALVGPGYVHIDDMLVSGGPGFWTLSGGTIEIGDADGTTIYLTGTVGPGDLVPIGTIAGAYTAFNADIVWTSIDNSIGSDAIGDLYSFPATDLSLAFTHASTHTFDELLQASGGVFTGGLTGSMYAIPAPGAILLGSLGVGLVGWLRRCRSL